MASIETLIIQFIGETNYNLTESDVKKRVDELFENLKSSASGDGIADKATNLAINALTNAQFLDDSGSLKSGRDYLSSKIYKAYNDAKSGLTTSISDYVKGILTSITKPITDSITEAVSAVGEDLKTEVSNIVSEGGDMVKEKVTSAIDDYLGDLGGTSDSGAASLASGFSLTYKEYLKAFVLLSVIGNETSMLQRCAELIQANMSVKNPSFDITKSYTMIEANASISVKSTFFNIPIITGVDENGNTTYDIDFGNISSGRQKINYIGIIGY